MAPRDRMIFKVPAEVWAAHGAILSDWDWLEAPEMRLAEMFPGVGFIDTDTMTADRRRNGVFIACTTPGAMIRMRAWAETLPPVPKPTEEEIAAVLAKRNPEKAV